MCIRDSLTPDKELNILVYWSPSFVIIYRSYALLKIVQFFLAHPVCISKLGTETHSALPSHSSLNVNLCSFFYTAIKLYRLVVVTVCDKWTMCWRWLHSASLTRNWTMTSTLRVPHPTLLLCHHNTILTNYHTPILLLLPAHNNVFMHKTSIYY